MRADVGRSGKVMRFTRGLGILTALAALVVLTLGSLADAAQMRGRGFSAPRPAAANRVQRMPGIRANQNRVNRVTARSVRPAHVNRNARSIRPTAKHTPRNSRGAGPYKDSVSHSEKPTSPSTRPPKSTSKPPKPTSPYAEGHPPRTPSETGHPPRSPSGTGYPPRLPSAAGYPPRPPYIPPVVPGAIGAIGAVTPAIAAPSNPPPPRPPTSNNRQPPRQQGPGQSARGPSGAPPAGEQRLVPDEVVVQLPPGTSTQALAALEARHQLVRLEQQAFQLTGESMVRWRIPDQRSVTAVIVALEADAGVTRAQPNYLFALQGETTGSAKGDPAQYAVAKLHLPEAHTLARGDKVLIGVVDSGIDVSHPELAGTIAESFDALPGEPPHSHGTGIAGTIVARSRLLGVAPGARILAARAFGASAATAQATTFNVLKGIDWAAKNGARVINMSFAGPRDPAIERELAAAYKLNIVLIAAAGNAGPASPPLYPAADANVIAVSATDAQDKLFDRANRGRYIAISAPGVDIIAPAPRGSYQITSGTSIAAAYISGLAALLIERSPNLTPSEVSRILQASARDLGKRGRDNEFGAGLADAYRALTSVSRPLDAVTTSSR